MSDNGDSAVSVRGLAKTYGKLEAVKGIDFEVAPGEVFGFLGPSGAGKTTTIGMLCTLVRPTAGSATVAGFDVVTARDEVRRNIGLVFQDPTVDAYLTAAQNLRFHAELYGVDKAVMGRRIDQVLDMVDLGDRKDSKVETFSGGMKRRLEIARGLLHSPRVLFLDEPTVGLDPQTRAAIWGYINELKTAEDITIFLTTHYMEEADQLCDRVAFIVDGRIALIDSPRELKIRQGRRKVRVEYRKNGGTETCEFPLDGVGNDEEFLRLLRREQIETIHTEEATLEDVFIKATGRSLA